MQTSTLMAYAADAVRLSRPLWYFEAKAIDTPALMAYAASHGDQSGSPVWADRVGIYMASAGLIFAAYIWTFAAITVGVAGAGHILAHGIGLTFETYAALTFAIWLACRTGIWITGLRRRLIADFL